MTSQYDKIPPEMHIYPQWVMWQYEARDKGKLTKIPYCLATGTFASVTEPRHWCTFQAVYEEIMRPGTPYNGIGFVLTASDPYTFIDLDATDEERERRNHQVIYERIKSYAELSPSGKGLHIITRASLPAGAGRRRGKIEIYDRHRFMTMTGNIWEGRNIIYDQPDQAGALWAKLNAGTTGGDYQIEDTPQTQDDEEIINMGTGAVNGQKFTDLMNGEWEQYYGSQSEADFALINMLVFYTKNCAQVKRIFEKSELGKREKAKRHDYFMTMLHRAYDQDLPPVDIIAHDMKIEEIKASGLLPRISDDGAAYEEQVYNLQKLLPKDGEELPLPPGIMGEIANFTYNASVRPLKEASIAAAIGLMSGICGRAYNVNGTGLNNYVIMLAKTGRGKESIASGISKIMKCLTVPDETGTNMIPAANYFMGPANIASGQALLRALQNPNRRSFVSIIGEFGIEMQRMSSDKASAADKALKRVLLDLYGKSGRTDVVQDTIYADEAKNTGIIEAPAVSIIGETNPALFYNHIDEQLILDGLLPRFLFIETESKRQYQNKGFHLVQPSITLIESLQDLIMTSLMLQQNGEARNVQLTKEAEEFCDMIDRYSTDLINSAQLHAPAELWNRAHLKVLKVGALCAVSRNIYEPVITIDDIYWSYGIVSTDTFTLANKFQRGTIGHGADDEKRRQAVITKIIHYIQQPHDAVAKYRAPQNLHDAKIIPLSYLQQRLATNNLFTRGQEKGAVALRNTLETLKLTGEITEMNKAAMKRDYDYNGLAYILPDPVGTATIIAT